MRDYKARFITLAQDIINTYDPYSAPDPDKLLNPEALAQFLKQHDIHMDLLVGEQELQEVRQLRPLLRQAFAAENYQKANSILQPLLEKHTFVAQFVEDEATNKVGKVELVTAPGTPLLTQLAGEAALGISLAFEHYGRERLRICAAHPCEDVFIDTSKNRSKRFCCEQCANRYNISAFRARQQKLEPEH